MNYDSERWAAAALDWLEREATSTPAASAWSR